MEDKLAVLHIGIIYLKDIGECEILVYEGDIGIPHFHIIKCDTNEDYCSISIFDSKYYKSHHYLTEYQKEQLNFIIRMEFTMAPLYDKKSTMWGHIRGSWLIANMIDDDTYDNNFDIPDYTKLHD